MNAYTDTAVLATERANTRAHEILCDAEQLGDALLIPDVPKIAEALASCFRELDAAHSSSIADCMRAHIAITATLTTLRDYLHKTIVEDIYEAIEVAEYEEGR